MILTRTPLRITLAGGGTDFPPYVKEHGGFAVTAAINRYVYVAVTDMFDPGYLLRYRRTEHVDTIGQVAHPVFRAALEMFDIPAHVEIVTMADLPAGTGLGSSGAFTVGLVKALAAYGDQWLGQEAAARTAAAAELGRAGRSGGCQDHFACAMGGLSRLFFRPDGKVRHEPMGLDYPLDNHLALFFTGVSRDAGQILAEQTCEGLDEIKQIGYQAEGAIEHGDIRLFGELMDEHWELKRRRFGAISNGTVDLLYARAKEHGAIGGKLVGAGGGGFLLCVTEDRERLAEGLGLPDLRISFDQDGVVVL